MNGKKIGTMMRRWTMLKMMTKLKKAIAKKRSKRWVGVMNEKTSGWSRSSVSTTPSGGLNKVQRIVSAGKRGDLFRGCVREDKILHIKM